MLIKNYRNVKNEEVSDPGAEKTKVRWVISEEDGAKNFFMRVFEMEAGGYTPLHAHPWEHEIFVYQGKGIIMKEGKETLITEGTVIFVPPNEKHQIKNTSGNKLTFICLVPPRKSEES